MPANVTCTFNSTTLVMDGVSTLGTTLTVGTIGLQTVASNGSHDEPRSIAFAISLPFVSLGIFFAFRKKHRALARLLMLLLAAALTSCLSSCADAVGSQQAAPGTSTITVTASDSTLSHTAQLAFTVTAK